MKLGICYMVFDGEELLEFAIKSIRNNVDFVAVTYQTTSYFGNPADPGLPDLINKLKSDGLIDEAIYFEPDLSVHHKINELNLRNIGLEASRRAGCTHHISADVDEFYDPNQLEYCKRAMEEDDYDFSMATMEYYYKDPTFLVYPCQNLICTLIHPVRNEYVKNNRFPYKIEITRRFKDFAKCRTFSKDEMIIHHMSYVRKDIRKKYYNSDNGRFLDIEKFAFIHNRYRLGGRLCLLPDFKPRRTIRVENKFGISF